MMGGIYTITTVVLLVLHLTSVLVFGCQKGEREALSKLKLSFYDPANRLSSWRGNDCCRWEGVKCNNVTNHVISIDLRNRGDDNEFYNLMLRAPKLEPSLVELRHLRYLDLSCNNFQASPIPEFIGSLKHLKYLNLSYTNFSGVVPRQLGNLTRLQALDLSWSSNSMTVTDLHWVSGISSLQYLGMSGSNLSKAYRSMQALSRLPSLSELRLRDCGLGNSHLSQLFSNLTTSSWISSTLNHLDISDNLLEGPLPHFLANLSSLKSLDLGYNIFINGSIPLWLRNMKKLESLILSENSFSHIEGGTTVMGLVKNLCNLKVLDFSYNEVLGGTILGTNESVSQLQFSLESLDLSNNNLTGTLPSMLGELRKLKFLNLGFNEFHGSFPTSIGCLSSLEELHLNDNHLSGPIPSSMGALSCLKTLDLSQNFLQGAVSYSHLANLSSLEELNLSGNSLKWELSSNWMPPFQLTKLDLGSSLIRGQLPQWIQTQKQLTSLHLFNTGIFGNLPEWLWNMNLIDVNLSHNHITGPITHFPSQLYSIDLSRNFLSGPLLQSYYSRLMKTTKGPEGKMIMKKCGSISS